MPVMRPELWRWSLLSWPADQKRSGLLVGPWHALRSRDRSAPAVSPRRRLQPAIADNDGSQIPHLAYALQRPAATFSIQSVSQPDYECKSLAEEPICRVS